MIDARLCGQYKRQLYSLPPPILSNFQFIYFFCEFLWIFFSLFTLFLFILFMLFNSHKQEAGGTWTHPRLFTHSHHETNSQALSLSLSRSLPSRLFGTKCDKCGNSFSKNDFVMRAKTKIFHIECFRCSACARQLLPGMCITPLTLLAHSILIFTHSFRRWIRVTWCGRPVLQGGSRCTGEVVAEQPHLLLRWEQQQH